MAIKLSDILEQNNNVHHLGRLMDNFYTADPNASKVHKKNVHPSMLASLCLKEYFFVLNNGVSRTQDIGSTLLLEDSSWEHLRIQNTWKLLGILYGDWLCHSCGKLSKGLSLPVCPKCGCKYLEYREVPLKKPEWGMVGRGDGILVTDKKRLGEIKSITTFQFSKLLDIKPEHKKQINIYLEMAKMDECWVVYTNRDNGKYKTFLYRKEEDIAQEMGRQALMLLDCLGSKKPPDIRYSEKMDYCNKRCIATSLCKAA